MNGMRNALVLLPLAALLAAQEETPESAGPAPVFRDVEVYLRPGSFEHVLEGRGGEVHYLLAFRYGLYGIDERGRMMPATAAVRVEFNQADRETSYWNPYAPLAHDAALHDGWEPVTGDPGAFRIEGRTTEMFERTLVVRLPRSDRWRLRVTGLHDDTASVRCVPTLVAIAEFLDEVPEAPEPAVFEEAPVAEVLEEEVVAAPPACPFCHTVFVGGFVRIGRETHYHCRRCTGAVHVHDDGRRSCSVLREGRRDTHAFPPPRPAPRVVLPKR